MMSELAKANKEEHRRAKELHRMMKHRPPLDLSKKSGAPIDCACVIHGKVYTWDYVERLFAMLTRNFSCPINLHVFTEHDRPVPGHMIKHILTDWPGVSGKKKAWWYKMQMFNPEHVKGQLLYFDLDTVISGDLDWIRTLPTQYFWAIKDFKYLWRANWQGINSSVMYWDTVKYSHIWQNFQQRDLSSILGLYPGDQDYLTEMIDKKDVKFLPENSVKSWRWQVHDGGMDFRSRAYRRPGAGAVLDPHTKIMIFHGTPKPHEIHDPVIERFWTMNLE